MANISAYLDQLTADYARELTALRAQLAEKEAAIAAADAIGADGLASELSLAADDLRDALLRCGSRDVEADAADDWDQWRASWRSLRPKEITA